LRANESQPQISALGIAPNAVIRDPSHQQSVMICCQASFARSDCRLCFSASANSSILSACARLLDVPRGLNRIDCPVTLVQGVADWVASGQTVRYVPLIPGSRFHPLLMAGHTPQSVRPATIARLVKETAARAAGPTAPVRAFA
jgi:pimeloyl-ACP methyl ester carboxylesterase